MNLDDVRVFLLWCTALNYLLVLVWFGVFAVAHDWLYRLHTRWFLLTEQAFDRVHYTCLAAYKLAIVVFNLVPLLALTLADLG